MKKQTGLGLLALLLIVSSLSARTQVFADAKGPACTFETLQADESGIVYEFRLNWIQLEETGDVMRIQIPGVASTGEDGAPELPVLSRLLALPPDGGAFVEILEQEQQTLQGICPAPAAPDRREQSTQEERSLTGSKDPVYYEGKVAWPPEPVHLGDPALWLGSRICPLDLYPLQYHPDKEALDCITRLRVRVSYCGGEVRNPGSQRRVPASFRECVAGQVDNPLALQSWTASESLRESTTDLGHYLVLIPDAAVNGLTTWLDWKRRQGYRVSVVLQSEIGGGYPQASQIKNYIQSFWDSTPFDYLLLVGDVDRNENSFTLMSDFTEGGQYAEYTWGGDIVTDHPYSLLEGDDYFSDVLVGRFSADNLTQLATISARCRLYEESPPQDVDQGWFSRAIMIYDVAEAGSRRETKQAIRDQLLDIGFSEVDTIRNHQTMNPVSPYIVRTAVEDGASLINYRGFGYRYSWHGPNFGNEHIYQLNNYGRWPFVTSIVCGGGDFGSMYSDPCFGEAWLRQGSVDEPEGAIAFLGPSEEDTHTMWNNAIDAGIYEGYTIEGLRQPGLLMQRGKVELWEVFPNDRQWSAPAACVPFYFHCYNLLGDPGLVLRSREPLELVCDLPAVLPVGEGMYSLVVTDTEGNPVEGVCACLHHTDTMQNCIAFSDASGLILLAPGELESGDEFTLTLSGQDMRGMSANVRVDTAPSSLMATKLLVNDNCAGNGDYMANPGEELRLSLNLIELGTVGLEGPIEIELRTPAGGASFVDSLEVVEDGTTSGDTLFAVDAFRVVFDDTLCHGDMIPFDILINDVWVSRRYVGIYSWNFDVLDVRATVGALVPGGNPLVELQLLNSGAYGGGGIFGVLETEVDEAQVVSGQLFAFDSVPDSANWCNTAELLFAEDLVPGMLLPCRLKVYGQGADPEYVPPLAETVFQIQLDAGGEEDPLGPDSFGHIIIHSEDDHPRAPEFVWNDIRDFGTRIDVEDRATEYYSDGEDGITRVYPLPFDFVYYGEVFDQITICSNGWIALGDREYHISGMNTPIPAAQGPPTMVAGYWCNLFNTQGSVFGWLHTYYNAATGELTFQWTDWRPVGVYDDVSFQVVLRDPAVWETSTGDGEILMYYDEVAYSNGRHGFTVGIENEDESEGLCYTFNNTYGEVCQEIEAGTALLVTSLSEFTELEQPETQASDFRILGASPNPFNPVTQVHWVQPVAGDLRYQVFNLRGQRVLQGELRSLAAGTHRLQIDLSSQSSGLYFLRLEAPQSLQRRASANLRLMLLK